MTILSIINNNPLIDGRQSENAMLVRRGLQILLNEMRHSVLPELALSSGRRADLISVSAKGEIWIIEIKSSIEDFRVDRKWPDYRRHCDRLFSQPMAGCRSISFPKTADCSYRTATALICCAKHRSINCHQRRANR